jgi:hypothetical protein
MQVRRNLKTLITLTALASLGSLAACNPSGRHPQSGVDLSVQWDSGPLDRAYGREHSDMLVRHKQEIDNPRADESSNQRDARQSKERQDLEARYARGKAAHSQSLPPKEQ